MALLVWFTCFCDISVVDVAFVVVVGFFFVGVVVAGYCCSCYLCVNLLVYCCVVFRDCFTCVLF